MSNTSTKSSNSYGRCNAKDAVWEKAKTIRGENPHVYRQDPYGNTLYYSSYGMNSTMGWHIDHIKPKSKGGSDGLRNLQAMQASKNMSLGNTTSKRR